MAAHLTPDERLLIKMIEKMPFAAEMKQTWLDALNADGLTEALADEIHQKLAAPVEGETNPAVRTRLQIEYTGLVRRWRLNSQKNIKR